MYHIYGNELQCIYSQKSEIRDKLKEEIEKSMEEIHRKILNRDFTSNDQLESQLLKLSKRLNDVKGKKVYGYLQQSIKKIVGMKIDSKRLRKLREKKIALGQKSDDISIDT